MSIKLDKYTPLMMYLSPASIPQIVAHIQDYLVKHPILSVETIAEIIVQSLQEHPELINGEAIPISADSAQSIKAYIDALPALDTYTKAEINALLLGKQDTLTFDQAPTPGSSNPVTSSGIIAAMSALQSALETQISAKADRASTYTKTQVDTLLEDKADADDVYTKNTMDAKLLEINTDIDNIEDDVSHQSQQIEKLTNNLGGVNSLEALKTGLLNTWNNIGSGSIAGISFYPTFTHDTIQMQAYSGMISKYNDANLVCHVIGSTNGQDLTIACVNNAWTITSLDKNIDDLSDVIHSTSGNIVYDGVIYGAYTIKKFKNGLCVVNAKTFNNGVMPSPVDIALPYEYQSSEETYQNALNTKVIINNTTLTVYINNDFVGMSLVYVATNKE